MKHYHDKNWTPPPLSLAAQSRELNKYHLVNKNFIKEKHFAQLAKITNTEIELPQLNGR